MTAIHVVDSIMGAGKTSWAIQMMNERPAEKFLYVTPYLNECDRIVKACGSDRFCEPHDKAGKTKLDSLKASIAEGRSVATTHELFKSIDLEVLGYVEDHGYILILDEVIDVIRPVAPEKAGYDIDFETTKYSEWVQALIDREVLAKGEAKGDGSAVSLIPGPEGRFPGFAKFRLYADEGRLVMVNGAMLVWLFPADCFANFKETYNLTYLFEGQAQKAYFDIHGLDYQRHSVMKDGDQYRLAPWNSDLDREQIERARGLINLYEGPANDIGWQTGKSHPLSKNWYLKNRKLARQIMKSTYNWFQRRAKAGQIEALWTVFKPIYNDGRLAPQGFKKSWASTTTRATNAYRERRAVAYLVNVFFRVPVARYLAAMGKDLDENLFAVSEMIQFVWRSRIREGKPIDLFIPSGRMRLLLKDWLNGRLENSIESSLPKAKAA
jgi:hypothetical protein